MTDEELIRLLLPHWYATRLWAEELLVRSLGLAKAVDVLGTAHRGRKPIPGSNWSYQTHGIGVDVSGKDREHGGIDFDFNEISPHPDPWRLWVFATKQWNAGNLPAEYRDLVVDDDRFEQAATAVLTEWRQQRWGGDAR